MLHAVIMAGGSGTRFWPKSRRDRPKQLLRLYGDRSMLQQTVDRIAPIVPHDRVFVITGADQAGAVRDQLPEIPAVNVVAEPCPRDTAACVGLAARRIHRLDPHATMIVMPADHMIKPADRFLRTVLAAAEVIEADPQSFVTFGIVPTRPETGYGYIERGEPIGEPRGVPMHAVVQFREKPDRATAEAFIASGRFFWNSGIFVWRAKTILDALAEHRPELARGLEKIGAAIGTVDEQKVLTSIFPTLERIPIDKAVMEKAKGVKVLEVVYDWNDVGDWRALKELQPPDSDGNILQGKVYAVDTTNAIVVNDDDGLIATLGLDDLVIVRSGGATLIARKDKLDHLKKLVEGLDQAGFGEML